MKLGGSSDRSLNRRVGGLLAACAYLPILLAQPGQISADTKTYLTLDPGRLISRAWSMWDPMVGAGTVTHQNIGYLFPLGPVYWAADAAHIPDWVTQRLWWGTILWVAAYGTWKLCRWLGWSVLPALVAAAAYGWSPYLLSYVARISAILLPWAALPWLIIFASLAVRESRWRGPARFALVIALVGSVNATSLLLVGLGPVVWVLAEWWGGRHRFSAVLAGGARTLVLTLGVSVWWMLGLWIQGAYGMPILDYTETYQVVASSSTPQEILRGLGYWFFYGGDRLGPWVGPSRIYLSPGMIAVGTVIAGISLLGLCTAFAGRGRALILLVTGLTLAVGAAPLGASTPYGAAFARFSTTTVGMAMRSTPRAAPLVILAMALGLGAAIQWVRDTVEHRRLGSAQTPASMMRLVSPLIVIAVFAGLFAQMHPWFTAKVFTESILRPSELPEYRRQLSTWLEETGEGRVWEIPGADFGSYRWGGTVDPVLPGMIDRPTLARELVPQGGAGTAGLLAALDTRIQEGTFEPESLLAVARLFGVQTIVMRGDLQHERYRLVRPGSLWPRLVEALGPPDFVGPMTTDQPVIPMIDEIFLADSRRVESYPIVAAWNLDDAEPKTAVSPVPVVVMRSGSATVIAGDGEGIVDSAAAGLLNSDRPLIFAASGLSREQWGPRPHLIVTDTNAKRARRWSTLSAHYGVLETAEEVAIAGDVGDQRLDLFPHGDVGDRDVGLQTQMVHTGEVAAIRATSYGNRFSFTPEDAAHFAMDGDPTTAWRTAVFDGLRGQSLEIDLKGPVSVDQIRILQPITRVVTRYLTEIQLHFDSGVSMRVTLNDSSRSLPGQLIPVPTIPFRSLRVELIADNLGNASVFAGQPGVGIAEIQIGDRRAQPTVQMPTAWLAGVSDLADLNLDLVMTRLRIDPAIPNRSDPEPYLDRSFDLPATRSFVIEGTARMSAIADDRRIETLLVAGDPVAAGSVWASARLAGSVESWGRAAVDGDLDTAWVTPFGLRLADGTVPPGTEDPRVILRPATTDGSSPPRWGEMLLTWKTGPENSQPQLITVHGSDGASRTIDVSSARDGAAVVDLRGLTGEQLELHISEVNPQFSPDYISGVPRMLPVAISEIAVTDVYGQSISFGALAEYMSDRCRDDLLEINGQSVSVRLRATTRSALSRAPIKIELCDAPLVLGPGPHRVVATSPAVSGLDLDRLLLRSATFSDGLSLRDAPVFVERLGPDRLRVVLDTDAEGWLILRESLNPGWVASDNLGSLGAAVLIDGYANGWPLQAGPGQREIMLEWTPQRVIGPGLIISGSFLLLAIGLSWGWRIRAQRSRPEHIQPSFTSQPREPQLLIVGVGLVIVGGPIAGATYVLLWWFTSTDQWARRWLAPATAFGLWGITALYTAALQFGYGFPADPDWPSRFGWMSPVTWAAVAAVLAARPGLGRSRSDH